MPNTIINIPRDTTLARIADAAERMASGIAVQSGEVQTYDELRQLIRAGRAEQTFTVGDQISVDRATAATATVSGSGVKTATVDYIAFQAGFLHSEAGNYTFVYRAGAWTYNGQQVTLSQIGIAITGTPAENDTITVNLVATAWDFDMDQFDDLFLAWSNGSATYYTILEAPGAGESVYQPAPGGMAYFGDVVSYAADTNSIQIKTAAGAVSGAFARAKSGDTINGTQRHAVVLEMHDVFANIQYSPEQASYFFTQPYTFAAGTTYNITIGTARDDANGYVDVKTQYSFTPTSAIALPVGGMIRFNYATNAQLLFYTDALATAVTVPCAASASGDTEWIKNTFPLSTTTSVDKGYYAGSWYVEKPLAAGTEYNILFWVGGVLTRYAFTPTAAVQRFSWLEWASATKLRIVTGASIQEIAMSASANGIDILLSAAARNIYYRGRYGSNSPVSNALRQWLNTDGLKNTWWKQISPYDVKPSFAATTDGFLRGLDPQFRAIVVPTPQIVALNPYDCAGAVGQTVLNDPFFLLSMTNVYMGNNTLVREGNPYRYYFRNAVAPITSAANWRVKRLAGVARNRWTRSQSSNVNSPHSLSDVATDGARISDTAYSTVDGGVPACAIG